MASASVQGGGNEKGKEMLLEDPLWEETIIIRLCIYIYITYIISLYKTIYIIYKSSQVPIDPEELRYMHMEAARYHVEAKVCC